MAEPTPLHPEEDIELVAIPAIIRELGPLFAMLADTKGSAELVKKLNTAHDRAAAMVKLVGPAKDIPRLLEEAVVDRKAAASELVRSKDAGETLRLEGAAAKKIIIDKSAKERKELMASVEDKLGSQRKALDDDIAAFGKRLAHAQSQREAAEREALLRERKLTTGESKLRTERAALDRDKSKHLAQARALAAVVKSAEGR